MQRAQIIQQVTTAVAVFTLLFGVINYFDQKRNEFRKEFWEQRFSYYKEVCSLTATIATSDSLNQCFEEQNRFWNLYWGELAMIEDQGVLDKMIQFGENLKLVEKNEATTQKLMRCSYELARACRKSLSDTWEPVILDDIDLFKKGAQW